MADRGRPRTSGTGGGKPPGDPACPGRGRASLSGGFCLSPTPGSDAGDPCRGGVCVFGGRRGRGWRGREGVAGLGVGGARSARS